MSDYPFKETDYWEILAYHEEALHATVDTTSHSYPEYDYDK